MSLEEVENKTVWRRDQMNEEDNTTLKQGPTQFIPKLRGKKILIRLVSGGQPVTGTIEGYNPYELLLQTAKGQLLVFKHTIATIEMVDEPRGHKSD